MAEAKKKSRFLMSTSEVLQKSIMVIQEGISDMLASKKEQWIFSVAHLVQQLNRKGQFLEQLTREWDRFSRKGLFSDDYLDTEQHQECLFEILDSLDKDVPDRAKFALLKKIFLISAAERVLDRNSILPQEYLRVCRTLTSGEITVMYAAYKIARKKSWGTETRVTLREWERKIAEASNLVHPELVALHAEGLERKRLLMPPDGPKLDKRPIEPYFGLTKLCWGICEYISDYKNMADALAGKTAPAESPA